MFSNLLAARAQMGTSLVFHVVFSVLGVGLPLLLCLAEGLALWRKDGTWLSLSRQWTKAFAVLFAIGAVSGAIVEFEIALLWSGLVKNAGAIIGLPFALEGFAFFIEGIFLGVYLFGEKRLTPFTHWLTSIPIVISGVTSAWFITSANSWMNSPTGFQLVNGRVTNVDPFAAILNPSTPYETTHMILACYVATGFGAAAVYAVGMLRGKRDDYHRKGLLLGMLMGASAIPFQIISGDFNARSLEQTQPAKYAAMEGVIHSGYGKPLYIGGIVDPKSGQVYGAIQIPHGESLISHFDLNSYTKGLDAFPPNLQPPAAVVHLAFDGMVGCALFMFFVGIVFWFLFLKHKRVVPEKKWLLWGAALTGPAAFLALELGWILTEEGRQPWISYYWILVKDAVNPAQWITVSFLVFVCIYLVLGTTLVVLLLVLARQPKPSTEWAELVQDEGEPKIVQEVGA
jgi:cytochrome bd ubiquinol oxidase subunit I